MATQETAGNLDNSALQLRRWPAVVITLLVLLAITVPTMLAPGTVFQFFGMMLGPIGGAVSIALWWLLGSRRPSQVERLVGIGFVVAVAGAAYVVSDESVKLGLIVHGTASVIAVVTAWFLVSGMLSWRTQLVGAAAVIVLTLGVWCMLRGEGVRGTITPEFSWRWSPTKEEQYVESLEAQTIQPAPSSDAAPLEVSPGDWVGFRGRDRDGKIRGVRIQTDWKTNPPQELWRRPIGPAWSSFTVIGDRVYTQEQRGDDETVLCVSAESGKELWSHSHNTRFWEAMAGAGPRATPTFDRGRIYATGANGMLHCLDAVSGEVVWARDIGVDGGANVPQWGFAGSPLVVHDTVFVYAGGGPGSGIVAYDRLSGEMLWKSGGGRHSYSSPQLVSLEDQSQVLMLTERGVFSLLPETGELLWEHEWLVEGMNRSVQPNVDGSRVFIGTGFGMGTMAVAVRRDGDSWSTSEEWTSTALKPYYNDFVIHEGHLYGFDGNIFACAEMETGKRKWKRGRYGNGQVLLLADQGVLLVLSEKGEVVLVQANSDTHEELAKMRAISGKTWNHPVIAGGRLFVRNAEEAACFALPVVAQQ